MSAPKAGRFALTIKNMGKQSRLRQKTSSQFELHPTTVTITENERFPRNNHVGRMPEPLPLFLPGNTPRLIIVVWTRWTVIAKSDKRQANLADHV